MIYEKNRMKELKVKQAITLFLSFLLLSTAVDMAAMPFYKRWYYEHRVSQFPEDIQTWGWLLTDLEHGIEKRRASGDTSPLFMDLNYCWDLKLQDNEQLYTILERLLQSYNNAASDQTVRSICTTNLLAFIKLYKLAEPTYWHSLQKKAQNKKVTSFFSWKFLVPAAVGVAGSVYALWYVKNWWGKKDENKVTHTDGGTLFFKLPDQKNTPQNSPSKIELHVPSKIKHQELGVKKTILGVKEYTSMPDEFSVHIIPGAPTTMNLEEQKTYYHKHANEHSLIYFYKDGNETRYNYSFERNTDLIGVIIKYIFRLPGILGGKIVASGSNVNTYTISLENNIPATLFNGWDVEERKKSCITLEGLKPNEPQAMQIGYVDGKGNPCDKNYYDEHAIASAIKEAPKHWWKLIFGSSH